MITFIGGKQRCKQNALRRAKQSDEKGQSDAIAATIVEYQIIYIWTFFLAFTIKIIETSVKVLPGLNVKHSQQAVGTHLLLLRQIPKDTHDAHMHIHTCNCSGRRKHKVISYYFLNI